MEFSGDEKGLAQGLPSAPSNGREGGLNISLGKGLRLGEGSELPSFTQPTLELLGGGVILNGLSNTGFGFSEPAPSSKK